MKFIIAAFILVSFTLRAQTPAEFNHDTYQPTYTLPAPEGWGIERFPIPIEFAPSIPYKGVEDVRFAPGWGNPKSEDYWSYAFLWYLDGKVDITAETTEKNLTAYYSGLVGRNIEPRKIPKEKLVPVKVSMKKTTTAKDDLKTFSGTIAMLDYMEQKPITFNCVVHVKACPGKENNTFVFTQISPKPVEDKVWTELQKLWTGFDCSVKK